MIDANTSIHEQKERKSRSLNPAISPSRSTPSQNHSLHTFLPTYPSLYHISCPFATLASSTFVTSEPSLPDTPFPISSPSSPVYTTLPRAAFFFSLRARILRRNGPQQRNQEKTVMATKAPIDSPTMRPNREDWAMGTPPAGMVATFCIFFWLLLLFGEEWRKRRRSEVFLFMTIRGAEAVDLRRGI